MIKKVPTVVIIFLFSCSIYFGQSKMPSSIEEPAPEPIKYTGELHPYKKYYDGALPKWAPVSIQNCLFNSGKIFNKELFFSSMRQF